MAGGVQVRGRSVKVIAVGVMMALASATAAKATSGFGCYRVNVGPDDPLRIRFEPDASSSVVASVSWQDQPIIALDGLDRSEESQPTLFDVHMAESRECSPQSLPLGARWCPVALYGAGETRHGWLKRRFVDHSECP